MALEKQVAIVTGAGQGIGQQIALRLAREGVLVVLADINEPGYRETAAMIEAGRGLQTLIVPTDITQEAQVISLMKRALELNGRIDILVNNSGIMGPEKKIEDITVEEWDETMAVNLRGMFLCCKHAIPPMKTQGGGASIVNISSMIGKRALPERSPYA